MKFLAITDVGPATEWPKSKLDRVVGESGRAWQAKLYRFNHDFSSERQPQ